MKIDGTQAHAAAFDTRASARSGHPPPVDARAPGAAARADAAAPAVRVSLSRPLDGLMERAAVLLAEDAAAHPDRLELARRMAADPRVLGPAELDALVADLLPDFG